MAPIITMPSMAQVQGILDRHGITMAEIEAQIDAEQAGIAEGTVIPLRRYRDE